MTPWGCTDHVVTDVHAVWEGSRWGKVVAGDHLDADVVVEEGEDGGGGVGAVGVNDGG